MGGTKPNPNIATYGRVAWVRFKFYEENTTGGDAETGRCGRESGRLSRDEEGVWQCGSWKWQWQ